jgi:hypothetical protein
MAKEDFKITIVNPSGDDIRGIFECEADKDAVAKEAVDFIRKNMAVIHRDWSVLLCKANGDPWGSPTTVAELDRN